SPVRRSEPRIDSSCCFLTAQESDSRSNVSLATQFFQQPVRRSSAAVATSREGHHRVNSCWSCSSVGRNGVSRTRCCPFVARGCRKQVTAKPKKYAAVSGRKKIF